MIILPVERKTWRARIVLSILYLFLSLGAITMVWPFLMMISGSVAGRFDYHRYSPVVRALWDEDDRFMRVLASFHARFPNDVFPEAPAQWGSWSALAEKETDIATFTRPWIEGMRDEATATAWRQMAKDFSDFNRAYDVRNSICDFDERDVAPYVRAVFEEKTGHQGPEVALAELNRTWDIRYNSFYSIRMRAQQRVPLHYPDWDWPTDPKTELWHTFKAHYREIDPDTTPYPRTRPYCIAPLWQKWRARQGLSSAPFPGDATDAHWQTFVTSAYPKRLLRIRCTEEINQRWQAYLLKTCKTPANYARLTGRPAPTSLTEIPLLPYENSALWRNFVATLPFDFLETTSPEAAWQTFLKTRYTSLEALNRTYKDRLGHPYAVRDWREIPMPLAQAFAVTYANRGTALLLQDMTANYRTVGDVLFLRGQAWWNTIVLVVLTILATLTVNPLAAYALSRFRLRHTEGILLFLLATMAFPAAVTAIPGFLLIRELGLLNTFAALVLPTVANGLSIFILKGFFDALPRELYEAATIDGASEWQIFRHITLPMTTPILAVNALNAFIAAYNSWEWALLVCQRQSHWTLSVWLYQMSRQFGGTPWVVMAGFVLVSIPTALVFLLCQRVILRGIVLPSMK